MNKKLLIVGLLAAGGFLAYTLYRRSKTSSPGLTTPGIQPGAGSSNNEIGLATSITNAVSSIFGNITTLAKPVASNNINGTPVVRTENAYVTVGLSEYGGGGADDQGPV